MSTRGPHSSSRPGRASRAIRSAAPSAAAPIFAALGDETRLELVVRLCTMGPLSIARLTDGLSITRQGVRKHLEVLAGAGLARGQKVGRDHVWEVDARRLDDARRCLDHIEAQWDEALHRLKSSLEGRPPGPGPVR